MMLSVIIVNWNTCDLLAGCLESLDNRFEVFVVDNGSGDGSPEMVRNQFPWVKLVENRENVGFGRANNQALRLANSKYLLLLNSDTKVLGNVLGQMVDFMESRPDIGAVGPRLLNDDGSLQPSCHPMLTPGREFWRLLFLDHFLKRATYNMDKWDVNTPRPVEVIKGACVLLRREALDQVGLFDEAYFMYSEEVDLCYRLAQAGWQLWWLPQAQVIHYGEASSKQIAEEMYIQLYRSKVQFYRKFGGEKQANWFKCLVKLAYWPRLLGSRLITRHPGRTRTYFRLLNELSAM